MNLADVVLCWNPNDKTVAGERRGAIALLPWPDGREAARGFRYMAGAPDARSHDARLSVRQEYAFAIAAQMVGRDRLMPAVVFSHLLKVSEYQSALAERLEAENSRRRVAR